MQFINLTPHPIVIIKPDGRIEIPPSGKIARVGVTQKVVGEVGGIPLVRNEWGAIEGLPEPSQDDVIYIVSSLVLARVRGRTDVVAPDTGPTAVRDETGRIIGIRRFVLPEE